MFNAQCIVHEEKKGENYIQKAYFVEVHLVSGWFYKNPILHPLLKQQIQSIWQDFCALNSLKES